MKQFSFKSILILLFVVSSITSITAQALPPPILTLIGSATSQAGSNGSRPLSKKTYAYTVFISGGGTAHIYVQLKCTNGVFTENGQTSYNVTKGASFNVNITWDTEGKGTITGVDGAGNKAEYTVNIEKPSISISGPSTIIYGGEAVYTLANVNPNISIKSIKWTHSPELKELAGSTQVNYKIGAVNNIPQTLTSGLQAVAQTGDGDLIASKTIAIEPLLSMQANNNIVCLNENVTYSISGFPSGGTVVWTSSPNATCISGQGTSSAVFKASASGYVEIKAVITYLGKTYNVNNSKVWVGLPDQTITADATKLSFLTTYNLYANNAVGATFYKWTLIGNATFENGSNVITSATNQVKIKTGPNNDPGMGQMLRVTCEATNKCGTTTRSTNLMFVISGLRSISIENTDQPEIKSVKIYNLSGILVYSNDTVNGIFDIKPTPLTDGVYIIEKFDGKNRTSEKVMLKR